MNKFYTGLAALLIGSASALAQDAPSKIKNDTTYVSGKCANGVMMSRIEHNDYLFADTSKFYALFIMTDINQSMTIIQCNNSDLHMIYKKGQHVKIDYSEVMFDDEKIGYRLDKITYKDKNNNYHTIHRGKFKALSPSEKIYK